MSHCVTVIAVASIDHVGLLRTDCSGQTRLALPVPSSRAGNRKLCYHWYVQVLTAQTSHTRHLSEAAELRQALRRLSSRLELAESDQLHLKATCKQTSATAEAEWAAKVLFPAVCLKHICSM